jgi:hypothetical protein
LKRYGNHISLYFITFSPSWKLLKLQTVGQNEACIFMPHISSFWNNSYFLEIQLSSYNI